MARPVPGRSVSDPPWGVLPLVVDTSAWARAHLPSVRESWKEVLLDRRLRLSPAVRFEILFSARDDRSFDALAERLSAIQAAPLTTSVIRSAEQAMRALAHRSAGAQRLPIVDYLVASAALELGAAVIHYDQDYDTLAELMGFESIWLAPAGTLP
jgi:predicted nucleic acid-binding protein